MTVKEAYNILGLPFGTELHEIKKKYKKLMMQVHPDASVHAKETYAYSAQEINTAYSTLKEKSTTGTKRGTCSKKDNSTKEPQPVMWDAPINQSAYKEREVLQYVTDYEGTVLGNFCVAKGKYLWTTEEDFPLFLLSIYRCSKQLLDEIDTSLHREEVSVIRHQFQTELTYLLAQQFIAGTALLKELAKEEKSDQNGHRIFLLSSMLESSDKTDALKPGEALYPSRLKKHRLYLKYKTGKEAGYLSFSDDRLYYVVIPLFEQRAVRIKIQAAEKQPQKQRKTTAAYQNLDLWIKIRDNDITRMPENLNLQIEQLLEKYK
ncbi:MAG: J domain-containing protein [Lachnospiraceae bacterium]|nr:J domain-containing protein [Lachnospiraceae bacterium]